MSNISAVTKVMQHHLEQLGYPSDNVQWSLSYCQGDGASFTGKLDLAKLGARLLPGVHASIWESCTVGLEITRGRDRYVHENSTSLSESSETVDSGSPDEYGGIAQKVAFRKLVDILETEIVQVGAELGRLGYKVLESYFRPDREGGSESVWCFRTENFQVEVFKIEDEYCNPLDFSDENFSETVAELTSGEWEICGSKVVISMLDEDGDPISDLAEKLCFGHYYKKSDPVFGSRFAMRELVSEAIQEARVNFAKISRPRLKQAA